MKSMKFYGLTANTNVVVFLTQIKEIAQFVHIGMSHSLKVPVVQKSKTIGSSNNFWCSHEVIRKTNGDVSHSYCMRNGGSPVVLW